MRSILFAASISAAFAIGAVACGSTTNAADPPVTPPADDDAGVDAAPAPDSAPPVDNGAPSTTYPAPHPPLPELVNQAGGKVLATPKVHLVFYPGYAHQTELTALAQAIGATPYWTATTSEYGVGPIAYDGMTELTGETPPTTIAETAVETFIAGKIASGAFGTPDADVIYTLVYPMSTTITMKGGPFGTSQSCTSFGGYHSDVGVVVGAAAKKNYAYAVLPTCSAFGGQDELGGVTGAMSHELVEAVTDPFPSTNQGRDSAFSTVDSDHFIWIVLGGGAESSDLCVSDANAFYKPQGLDFVVQRSWSNKLAKAGHNPCAPNVAGLAYFNSAPVLTETVTLDVSLLGGGSTDTKGITIAIGKTKTIEVDLFSDAATSGPWTVSAIDTASKFTGGPPTLDFAWDRTQGVNGEKLHLSVTVKAAGSPIPGAHPFSITSTLGQKKVTWPGLVVDQ